MVNIKLDTSVTCPVIRLDNGTRVLIDSGASLPVWTRGFEALKIKYNNAYMLKGKIASVQGFIGEAKEFNIAVISELVLPGNMRLLNLPVVLSTNLNVSRELIVGLECVYRQVCQFNFQPKELHVDSNVLYAQGYYNGNRLWHVTAHTEAEYNTITKAQKEIFTYTDGNAALFKKLVKDIYTCAPDTFKNTTRFSQADVACLYWNAYRNTLR